MRIIDAATVAAVLKPAPLVLALRDMFRTGCTTPVRHHHAIDVPGTIAGTLLLMPAWQVGAYIGTKIVTIFPGNSEQGLATVSAGYLLMDGKTGLVLALIDGGELTAKRTAATSALAAGYLAREDAKTLLVIGTGRIAEALARCHYATRPLLEDVQIWGRSPAGAERLTASLRADGIPAHAVAELPVAIGSADIVASATLAMQPLIHGDWVRAGTHLDLVGGYTPAMREADDALIAKGCIFADTCEGALKEAGDLVIPCQRGILHAAQVRDLHALTRGEHPGRALATDITVFKSVGAALEDLAAAILVYEST